AFPGAGGKSSHTSPLRLLPCILAKVAGMGWVSGSSGSHAHPPLSLDAGAGIAVAGILGPCTEEGDSMGVLDLLLHRRRRLPPPLQPPPPSLPLTVQRLESRELFSGVPVLVAAPGD